VVDDKFPDQAAGVLAHVKEVSPLPVRYVLNSHHHADHVSGNAVVRGALDVDIVGHKNIRENFLRLKQPGEPTLTFDDRMAIVLGGVEVRLLWLGRGHTNGDTVIYFPDLKTVHVGDLVIDGMPVIDYPGGGSAVEFLTTIDNRQFREHHHLVRRDDQLLRRACRALNDRGKPRVVTHHGRPRQQLHADHVADAFVERPAEAREHLIGVAEAGVDEREIER
jgi:glyoxylase-like metal-dependent hydrolase (beta-lactamase superfamily II)